MHKWSRDQWMFSIPCDSRSVNESLPQQEIFLLPAMHAHKGMVNGSTLRCPDVSTDWYSHCRACVQGCLRNRKPPCAPQTAQKQVKWNNIEEHLRSCAKFSTLQNSLVMGPRQVSVSWWTIEEIRWKLGRSAAYQERGRCSPPPNLYAMNDRGREIFFNADATVKVPHSCK